MSLLLTLNCRYLLLCSHSCSRCKMYHQQILVQQWTHMNSPIPAFIFQTSLKTSLTKLRVSSCDDGWGDVKTLILRATLSIHYTQFKNGRMHILPAPLCQQRTVYFVDAACKGPGSTVVAKDWDPLIKAVSWNPSLLLSKFFWVWWKLRCS